MSNIRRQSIISSILIYVGFLFGALNTYLFTKQGLFTTEQYGLTRAIIYAGNFLYSFASMALPAVIYKFSPYYRANVKDKDNDLLSVAMVVCFIGFVVTCLGGFYFEPLVVKKFSSKSPMFVQYYFWVFPYLFFYLFFSLLEAHAWSVKKTVASNFLREAVNRISITFLIIIFIVGGLKFDLFVKIFSCLYAISFFGLLWYLVSIKKLHFVFKLSRVTKKYWKKMLTLFGFVYGGIIITTTAASIDSFTISSYIGMGFLGIYDVGNYMASLISVPQKSIASISTSYLAEAWRNKDLITIQRIYTRSSINLLLLSTFLFLGIWLNYDHAMDLLPINQAYRVGKIVVLILGIKFIIDMGTGVNQQIIGTSNYWRFEFLCGVILLSMKVPITIYLVKKYDIAGAAYSDLIAYSIYNVIRLYFLWAKFKLQPFTIKTVYILLTALISYAVCYLLFHNMHSWMGLIGGSLLYVLLFGSAAVYFNLSPDIEPVWLVLKKRLGIDKKVD